MLRIQRLLKMRAMRLYCEKCGEVNDILHALSRITTIEKIVPRCFAEVQAVAASMLSEWQLPIDCLWWKAEVGRRQKQSLRIALI